MKRLELARVRVCGRCGRGAAELHGRDGERLDVPLDSVRARQLADPGAHDLRSLTDLVLDRLGRPEAGEVVLELADGRLRALLSLADGDVVACTADEGVALAIRGGLDLYATDDALAGAARRPADGGPHTVH